MHPDSEPDLLRGEILASARVRLVGRAWSLIIEDGWLILGRRFVVVEVILALSSQLLVVSFWLVLLGIRLILRLGRMPPDRFPGVRLILRLGCMSPGCFLSRGP